MGDSNCKVDLSNYTNNSAISEAGTAVIASVNSNYDFVEVVQGCDKTLYTCVTKFQNLINGDHEPHIPTSDQAQNNPGAT